MKLRVDTKSFVEAVNWTTKNYEMKDDKAYIALSVNEDGTGFLSHSNPTSYMKSDYTVLDIDFTGDDVEEAKFAVDGKFLKTLAKAIGNSDGDVIISKKLKTAKTALEVKTSSGKFTLPLLDSVVSESPEVVELGEVDDNEFFDMLLRISKLCDTNPSGASMFTGAVDLRFNAEEKKVKMFATDRFALAETVLDFSPSASDDEDVEEFLKESVLLPHANAILVPPTRGITTSITLIGERMKNGAMRLGYAFPDGRTALFSLLNAKTFSNVESMKQGSLKLVENHVTVAKAELMNAINVVSSLAWSEDHIYLTVNKKGLTVSDSTDSNSLSVDHSDLDYDSDEPYRAKFLRATINESFSPISTADVALKWGPSSKAFVFEPITEDGESVDSVFVMSILSTN